MLSTYQHAYNQTPKGKYIRQRANANRRQIPWDFTFETWWKIWQDSGKWDERGTGPTGFVMSRIDDQGAYSPGNVEIKTMRENTLEHVDSRRDKQDGWSPYQRTTAWEYTVNGVPVNRIEGKS